MKRLRLGYREVFFVVLIVMTVVARLIDAWPASSRDIDALRTLAATNDAARLFIATSLSADESPSTKDVRRWSVRVEAIEGARARGAVSNPSGRTSHDVGRNPEMGAQFR